MFHFQNTLHKDFGYDDDTVVNSLERAIEELKRSKLDSIGPTPQNELPKRPFGAFTEPSFDQKIGRRADKFSETEQATNVEVKLRRDLTAAEVAANLTIENNKQRDSHFSVGEGSGLAGTDSEDNYSTSSVFSTISDDNNINALELGLECTRL